MNEQFDPPPKLDPKALDAPEAPLPGVQPRGRKDRVNVNSPDARSAAPSEGSGVCGNVEPPRVEQEPPS